MPRQIGDRVGALLKGEGDTVWLLGYGVYQGYQTPDPSLGVKFFGLDLDHPNPCIKLDSGQLVFGCECWWGDEAGVKQTVARYAKVIDVDIEEARREAAERAE
jgi:hypothetical protein